MLLLSISVSLSSIFSNILSIFPFSPFSPISSRNSCNLSLICCCCWANCINSLLWPSLDWQLPFFLFFSPSLPFSPFLSFICCCSFFCNFFNSDKDGFDELPGLLHCFVPGLLHDDSNCICFKVSESKRAKLFTEVITNCCLATPTLIFLSSSNDIDFSIL